MKILIAADHAGFHFKEKLKELLPKTQWEDLGPSNADRVDYPDFAHKLAKEISKAPSKKGVLICGSGVGVAISANKHKNVRAAHAESTLTARLSREHNDANVLCLGARILAPEYGAEMTDTFLSTPFSNEPRHQARIEKIEP